MSELRTISGRAIAGPVGLSVEAAYRAWLADPLAPCMHLVRIMDVVGNGGQTFDIKLSDREFEGYLPVIKSIPSGRRQVGDGFSGRVTAGVGSLVLSNHGGELDTWPRFIIDGREFVIRHGHPDWPEEWFHIIDGGIVDGPSGADSTSLSYRLRPKEWAQNRPIQENLISSGPNENAVQPITLGQCFNISPVLVDAANRIYQWHDPTFGAATAVDAVRDGGLDLQTPGRLFSGSDAGANTLTTTEPHGFIAGTRVRFSASASIPGPLQLNTDYWVIADGLTADTFKLSTTWGGSEIDITGIGIATNAVATGYHWTADLSAGTVRLAVAPEFDVTMDVRGYLSRVSQILPMVLQAENVDPASVAALDAAGWTGLPGNIGLYIKERANRLDLADKIANGLRLWYGYTRDGMFRMGRIFQFDTTDYYHKALLKLTTDDFIQDSLSIDEFLPLRYAHRMRYQRNWTPGQKLASGVSDEARALYTEPGPIAIAATPTVQGQHRLATQPDVIESLYYPSAASLCEDMDGQPGSAPSWSIIGSVELKRIGYLLDVGDKFFLPWTRWFSTANDPLLGIYGFPGYPCNVIDVEYRPHHGADQGAVRIRFLSYIGDNVPEAL